MSNDAPDKVKTGAELYTVPAVIFSFLDRPLDFYPRLGRQMDILRSENIIERLHHSNIMGAWTTLDPSDRALDKAIELAKASLQEAKAQTEYQDQKATRLLTVSTFLTALAGAFFTTLIADYPLKTLSQLSSGGRLLLTATYVFFSLFIFFRWLARL